ncbi:hypothetical protein U472_03435 [Orenia metallireducens]|uniref:Glycosyltransferase 2-like domain-containing protein n=1 Tax=Orenia metallireducens TaxID=1413210 RepID=A0A1C0AB70_9FIRM|nr:glycosyltransferase [Orenia metallireducens]OCL27617.1 hypothetical protein U472_03435 [Orenia metallireducens]
MPEISVLMSVYNGEEFINESINSILNQTYKDFEFIIVNDGSTDRTQEIIESYDDNRIRLFNFEKNQGVGSALNFGLSKVRGKYVAKADSDDIFISTRLEEQKKFLDENDDIAVVGGLIEYFPHNKEVEESSRYKSFKSLIEVNKNKIINPKDIREKIYWYCCMNHTIMMIRTNVINKIGYIDIPMGTDYNLFYQLNKLGYKMAKINKVLAKMRISKTSITAKNKDYYYKQSLFSIKQEEINNLFKENNQVYIWGAGSMGKNLFYVLTANNLNIKGFIDNNKEKAKKRIERKEIYGPEIINRKGIKNIKIIIASQPGKFEIVKYLRGKGYKHLQDFLVYS